MVVTIFNALIAGAREMALEKERIQRNQNSNFYHRVEDQRKRQI